MASEQMDAVEASNAAEYPAEEGETGPVVISKRGDGQAARPPVELFTLNGRTYSMSADLRPAITLRFFREVRTIGYEAAWVKLMSSAIPQDAMDALAESEDVEPEDIAKVMAIVTDTALGSIKRMREAAGEQ